MSQTMQQLNQTTDTSIMPLLGDLSNVPPDYIQQVSSIKRFLERWTIDPSFRDTFHADPPGAISSLGLSLHVDEVMPLIDDALAIELNKAIKAGEDGRYPISVLRYRAFYREKRLHRRQIRKDCRSSNPRIAAWRARQINRCIGELGINKADALVHAPLSIEIAKGCSVGCWFCGVAAPKLDHTWPYNEKNRQTWRSSLKIIGEVMGTCAKQGFLYWATDPLDNPDYEKFLVDFHEILGRCPQTTTAMGSKDIERTRKLLRLSHSMNSTIDRFSIITLRMLHQLHAGFKPEELIRVECIPQNREAADKYRKANAGRARTFQARRGKEMMPEEASSTIACVSGFLFNMMEQSVRLITPCNASERWPLGYWVVDEGNFNSPEELRTLLEAMVERNMAPGLKAEQMVCLRPDLTVEASGTDIFFRSRWIKITFHKQTDPEALATMLAAGKYTAGEFALRREAECGVPLAESFVFLDDMLQKGLLDEEPYHNSMVKLQRAAG